MATADYRLVTAGSGITVTENVPGKTMTIGISDTSIALLSGFAGADSTARLQAAIASGVTALSIDENGSLTATIAVPAGMTIFGNGRTMTKAFNGDMFTLATGAQVHDLNLSGGGATYSGRGFLISAGTDQRIHNCNVLDMSGYCIEFSADSAGSRALVAGGVYQRTTSTNPAIKVSPDAQEAAGERKFFGLQSAGGWLFDTAGSQNTHIIGCSTLNMVFGVNSLKTIIADCRLATGGVDLDVLGQDHQLVGCIVAGNINLNIGAGNVTIVRPTLALGYNIIDNSGANNNSFDWEQDITLTLGSDSGSPTLGNGTLTARMTARGRHRKVEAQLIFGSTTAVGTGTFFTLPTAWQALVKKTCAKGVVYAVDSGTGVRIGATRLGGGIAPKIYLASDNQSSVWGSAIPVTWTTNDVWEFTAEWETGS